MGLVPAQRSSAETPVNAEPSGAGPPHQPLILQTPRKSRLQVTQATDLAGVASARA